MLGRLAALSLAVLRAVGGVGATGAVGSKASNPDSIFALPTTSVVKVYTTSAERSYLSPWSVKAEQTSSGTGFVLPNQLIMTNAHVVDNALYVEVKKEDEAARYPARVVSMGHDVDLALLKVDDDDFWTKPVPLKPISWANQPGYGELYSEVRAVGFPTGGNTICVTKGVVSRIDAQRYVHCFLKGLDKGAEGVLPIIQIDAAINPGSSGGPAFDSVNSVVGVASSAVMNAQNVGYIIPAAIAQMFLQEYQRSGTWAGISNTGLDVKNLVSEAMRASIGLGDRRGVRVIKVAPLGAAASKVKVGDVIMAVDDTVLSSEGTIPMQIQDHRVDVPFMTLITQKAKGEATKLKIFRDGKDIEETIVFTPIPPLGCRYDRYDCSPQYILVGGLVFTRMTMPLYLEYKQMGQNNMVSFSDEALKSIGQYKNKTDDEVVILLRGMKHKVNLGCQLNRAQVLKFFNNKTVDNLKALAFMLEKAADGQAAEEFLRFRFSEDKESGLDSIVMRTAEVKRANVEICETHRIAKQVVLDDPPGYGVTHNPLGFGVTRPAVL